MKLVYLLTLFSINAFGQLLDFNLPKGIKVNGNIYEFGPLNETQLSVNPIIPKILKNRKLDKEFLCMKFFNNQIRKGSKVIDLNKNGNFLYARFNWIRKDKKEVINKRLFHNKKTKCHFIGNYKGHELYKIDGKKIFPHEAKDIRIFAYTNEEGGYSIGLGKDSSLVKSCQIKEPHQTTDTFQYNELPAIEHNMINCHARFRCHKASTQLKFDAVKEGRPIAFEFNGYCVTKKNGKYTCAKVHPDHCADAYLSAVIDHQISEKQKKKRRESRYKNKNKSKVLGSGSSR